MLGQGLAHQGRHRGVEPVGVGDGDDPPTRRELGQPCGEGVGALPLAEEDRAAEGDEHVAGARPQPLRDEVCRGAACRGVVQADVGGSATAAHVGHQRHHGDAPIPQPERGRCDLRVVRGLQQHAVRGPPARADRVQSRDGRTHVSALAQVEACPDHGGTGRGQLGLEGLAHGGAEPCRRLHHHVEHEGPRAEPQLGLLAVEVEDGLLDGPDRASADTGAAVEHPVDRRRGQAGLLGDVAQAVLVGHDATLRGR